MSALSICRMLFSQVRISSMSSSHSRQSPCKASSLTWCSSSRLYTCSTQQIWVNKACTGDRQSGASTSASLPISNASCQQTTEDFPPCDITVQCIFPSDYFAVALGFQFLYLSSCMECLLHLFIWSLCKCTVSSLFYTAVLNQMLTFPQNTIYI